MVFFVREIKSPVKISALAAILAAAFCLAVPAYSISGSLYPDVELKAVSGERIILTYHPELSEDLKNLGHGSLLPAGGREAWGRIILLAVPPGGRIEYTSAFARAGMAEIDDGLQLYISDEMPLVRRGEYFRARGHSLVQLMIFPQRIEDGRLAAYTDFRIDIRLVASGTIVDRSPRLSRLDSVLAGSVINPEQFYRFGTATRRADSKPLLRPVFSDHQWVKIAVEESGVMRVNGSALQAAGIDLTDFDSDSIRIYYAGGINPPEDISLPGPELYQVSVKVEDGGDGFFGPGDYLLFYAEGPDRYEFENGESEYLFNSYNTLNYYWFATGDIYGEGRKDWSWCDGRIEGTPDRVVSKTRRPLRVEQDHLIKVDGDGRSRDYFPWYWSDKTQQTITVNLPRLVGGDSVDIEMGAITSYNLTSLSLNGTDLPKTKIGDNLFRFWDNRGLAVTGLNTMRLDISHVSGQYLDYFDIDYAAELTWDGSQLFFNSRGLAGIIRYLVTGYTPSHYVLNITNPDSVALVNGVEILGDTARFQRPESSIRVSRYVVYSDNSVHYPENLEQVDPEDLRRDVTQCDAIAIAPRRFLDALQEYADYRFETDGYRVRLTAVEDIYNNFGYGLMSPMAIRNYLRFAFENYEAPAPFAAILVGDGHYDFRDNMGYHTVNYIPPFIWDEEQSVGDDNYVYFGSVSWLDSDSSYINEGDRGWDMMIARWPVRSSAEITDYLEAMRQYESPENRGNWRTRITYVADDEFKSNVSNEIIHTAMAETLAVYHTPSEYVRNKIYATEYPFASNGEKPEVNDDIVKAINDGTLIINYVGHGSPDVWADEHILKKGVDLSRLNNEDKLTVVIAGSCSIGFFDDPAKEGMSEILFRQRGGALQTVSATRLVYATQNATLNYDLFDIIFGNHCNPSEALYTAKVMHQYSYNSGLVRNDRSFVVFGDPLGYFGLPEYKLVFDNSIDTMLTPLEPFNYSGMVTDQAGNPLTVDGEIELTAYDSRIIRTHELGVEYALNGPAVFRGKIPVQAGIFEGSFMVPLDIDYGGLSAYLTGYGRFGSITGIGGRDSLKVALSAGTTSDNSGPEIAYSIEEVPEFVSGGRVPANATVNLDISDVSGINLTGGLGHRIELVIDNNNNNTVNLTDLFSYNSGSSQSGSLAFALPDLTSEPHRFKIRAWDNANNPAEVEFEATPSEESRIALYDVMNYPNPMEESTEFFFDLSETADWVELKIFTLSGRLIKKFREENPMVGKNRRFSWDGRDMDGDRVAEGVYIYKLSACGSYAESTGSADNMAEVFGKLVLLN